MHGPGEIRGTSVGAEEQDEPITLQIYDGFDSFQELGMGVCQNLQSLDHELAVPRSEFPGF